MEAEKPISPLDIPQSERKHLDFILLNKSVYERWVEAKKAHGNKFKDNEFADFLLNTLEQQRNSSRDNAHRAAEVKVKKETMTYARGTQTIPVPKDLYKELDAISLTLQFKSIVQTVRHLVDLFHEKYPTIKLMNGVPPAKRPRIAPKVVDTGLDYNISQGVIPGELLQPVEEDDSMSFLIKNVLQTIESENKNPVVNQQSTSSAASTAALAAAMSPSAAVASGMAPPPKTLDPSYVQKGFIYECTYCQKILKSQDEIDNHVYQEHGYEPFFCRLCQSCASVEEDMIQHVQQTHEHIYLCGFRNCNYSAAREGSIHGHYVASHCKGQVFSTIQVRKGNMWDMYMNRRETCFGLKKTRVVQMEQAPLPNAQ